MADRQEGKFLNRFFEAWTPQSEPARSRFLRARASFAARGIKSNLDLLSHYSSFTPNERLVAILIFMHHHYQRATTIILAEILSNNDMISGSASAALASFGGERNLRRLIRMVHQHSRKRDRLNLVSALAMISNVPSNTLLINSLVGMLMDTSEFEECRATAAEGLANALQDCDKRTSQYRRAIEVMMRMLDDPSPNVRFCCAFSLGQLKVKKALVKLREMARNDHAKCSGHAEEPGGWTVSKEADEAIEAIEADPVG